MASQVYISRSSGEPGLIEPSSALRYNFGLINGGSDFFLPVESGWENRCRELGLNCHYWKPPNLDVGNCSAYQIELLEQLAAVKLGGERNYSILDQDIVLDGIALAPCDVALLSPSVKYVVEEAGVPITTFDTDMPETPRAAYVGTDNYFMGVTMAQVAQQLRPEGGTFLIVSASDKENIEARVDGFRAEISKDNEREGKAQWHEIKGSPAINIGDDLSEVEALAELNPTVLAIMYQSPMRSPNWTDFVDDIRPRNITIVGTDGSAYQLDYLNRRYVDGLVGQLPYDFGSVSVDVHYELKRRGKLAKSFYATNLISYTLIPLVLPPYELDQNLLGNLVYMGYTALVLIVLTAFASIIWTIRYHKELVVRAAQPFFLIMVASGVIVLGSALIPLSFDDDGAIYTLTEEERVAMCMSIPWLSFTGFTIVFAALFSKTWRVNRLFNQKTGLVRMEVKVFDVLAPFAVLLTCNIIVLLCWTIIDPLTYTRVDDAGMDYWGRIVSTYGACRSENVKAYLIPLAIINLAVITIAVWQAFRARDIKAEFAETKYIGLALSSIFQGLLTGVPILVIVKDDPQSFYVVFTLLVFLLCMAVLLLIFVPKVIMRRRYAGMPASEQRRVMAEGIRRSSGAMVQSYSSNLSPEEHAQLAANRRHSHSAPKGFDSSSDWQSPSEPLDSSNKNPTRMPLATLPEDENHAIAKRADAIINNRKAVVESNSSGDIVVSSAHYVSSITLPSQYSEVVEPSGNDITIAEEVSSEAMSTTSVANAGNDVGSGTEDACGNASNSQSTLKQLDVEAPQPCSSEATVETETVDA